MPLTGKLCSSFVYESAIACLPQHQVDRAHYMQFAFRTDEEFAPVSDNGEMRIDSTLLKLIVRKIQAQLPDLLETSPDRGNSWLLKDSFAAA